MTWQEAEAEPLCTGIVARTPARDNQYTPRSAAKQYAARWECHYGPA